MIKKTITYEDFDGEMVTDEFFFNLSLPELMDMEVSEKGGFGEMLQKLVAENDKQEILNQFKKIILASYGKKSPDGKRFVKSPGITADFEQTNAFGALLLEFMTNTNSVIEFANALLPKEVAKRMEAMEQGVEVAELPSADVKVAPFREMTREEQLEAYKKKVQAAQES